MKVLRKTVSLLLIFSFCLAFLSSCAVRKDEELTQNLPINPSAPIKYADGFAKSEAKKLYIFTEGRIRESYGDTLPMSISLLEGCFADAINALEARGVSSEKTKEIIQRFYENGEVLDSLLASAKDGTAPPFSSLILLFGELARTVGVEGTSLFMYDIILIYCEYMVDKYTALYMKNPSFTYLFKYAVEWQNKYRNVEEIGEDNFSSIIRVLVSLSSLKSAFEGDGENFTFTLSSGELAIFLKNEGRMISRISLSEDDAIFLLEELGNSSIPLFKAIKGTSDEGRFAEHIQDIQSLLVTLFSSFDKDAVTAISEKNISRALYLLFQKFSDEDIEKFSLILEGEDEEKYKEYFAKENTKDKYLIFKEETGGAMPEELRAAGEDEFLSLLKAFMNSKSPALTFTVFGYD